MKSSVFFLAMALMAMVFNSCGEKAAPAEPDTAAPDLNQLKSEIQAMEDAYAVALNTKDVDAILSFYADDAVIYRNNQTAVSGKDAIRQAQEEEMQAHPAGMTFQFETIDIFADGDLLVETGKSTVTDSTGNTSRTGKYMCLFTKRDGKYLCIREMYNDDEKQE